MQETDPRYPYEGEESPHMGASESKTEVTDHDLVSKGWLLVRKQQTAIGLVKYWEHAEYKMKAGPFTTTEAIVRMRKDAKKRDIREMPALARKSTATGYP